MGSSSGWPPDAQSLVAEQELVGALTPPAWTVGTGQPAVAGCFVAYWAGEAGPGRAGDRAWVAAVVMVADRLVAEVVVPAVAPAPYEPGLLALREGAMLAAAVTALGRQPDVLLVDATGRDHPRRAGLALHLGAVIDVPTVGVTHRPLRASGPQPGPQRGAWSRLDIDGDEVARWVRTRVDVRPVVAHAAWRTSPDVAVDVVMRSIARARTPEPLRLARQAARLARSAGGGNALHTARRP